MILKTIRVLHIYRGYYTGAKIWFLFSSGKTIFYERAQRVIKILFLPRENKIHIFKPPCNVLFCYIDMLMTAFLMISDHLLKISEDFPKLFRKPDGRSRTFSKNFRRLPKTFEEDPKMFGWYTNEFKYNLRDKLWTIRHPQRWHTEYTPFGSRMKWHMESTSDLVPSKTLLSK